MFQLNVKLLLCPAMTTTRALSVKPVHPSVPTYVCTSVRTSVRHTNDVRSLCQFFFIRI